MDGAYRLEFKKSLKIKPPPDVPETRLKLKIFMRCSPMQIIDKVKGKPRDHLQV